VDLEIRPHNRQALEQHELSPGITLLEGDSTSSGVLEGVRGLISSSERVLVVLDSNHTKAHVGSELRAYAPMVTEGSYIVATDGVMEDLFDVPRGRAEWRHDNPAAAAREFVEYNSDFVLETPPFAFNETLSSVQLTHWPCAFIKRVGSANGLQRL
jgi:cephalosporin hydroxylase